MQLFQPAVSKSLWFQLSLFSGSFTSSVASVIHFPRKPEKRFSVDRRCCRPSGKLSFLTNTMTNLFVWKCFFGVVFRILIGDPYFSLLESLNKILELLSLTSLLTVIFFFLRYRISLSRRSEVAPGTELLRKNPFPATFSVPTFRK